MSQNKKCEPIRVLQVIGIMNRGGTEAMIMNLYRQIDRSKVQFDFVEHTSQKAAYDDEILQLGGRIYHCPGSDPKNLVAYVKWWNAFFQTEGKGYRIVHGHIGSTASIYLKIAKKYGKYAIAHSHSAGDSPGLKGLVYRAISYETRYIADYFFACSAAAGENRFGKKACRHTETYSVLRNAIDTRAFCFDLAAREQMRKTLKIPPETLLIGHVGRFTAEKNHRLVLKVFAELQKKQENSCLLLIGDGPLKTEMEQLARQLHLEEHVQFLGVRSDVSALMQAMDVFLFPSVFEGLPVTLVEAQTADLPCLISDNIPKESILLPDAVRTEKLDTAPEIWADELLGMQKRQRTDRTEEIRQSGFDVSATAKWLEEFYCDRAKA